MFQVLSFFFFCCDGVIWLVLCIYMEWITLVITIIITIIIIIIIIIVIIIFK